MTRSRGPRGFLQGPRLLGVEEMGTGAHGVGDGKVSPSRWQMVLPSGSEMEPVLRSCGKEEPPDSWKSTLGRGCLRLP